VEAGLTYRPLLDTVQDTLAWAQTLPPDPNPKTGLTLAREAELLAAWHQSA
jgi:2'-hydroxyisoflavone reductase